jgi:hypothetical protein
MHMKAISYGVAAIVALGLFAAFGSVGASARPSVTSHVVSMHVVMPDGALMKVNTAVSAPLTTTERGSL